MNSRSIDSSDAFNSIWILEPMGYSQAERIATCMDIVNLDDSEKLLLKFSEGFYRRKLKTFIGWIWRHFHWTIWAKDWSVFTVYFKYCRSHMITACDSSSWSLYWVSFPSGALGRGKLREFLFDCHSPSRNTTMKLGMRSNPCYSICLILADKDSKKVWLAFDALADQVIPGRGQIHLMNQLIPSLSCNWGWFQILNDCKVFETAIESMDQAWDGPRPAPCSDACKWTRLKHLKTSPVVHSERQLFNSTNMIKKQHCFARSNQWIMIVSKLMDDTPSQAYVWYDAIIRVFSLWKSIA